jgi:hypothetical protein
MTWWRDLPVEGDLDADLAAVKATVHNQHVTLVRCLPGQRLAIDVQLDTSADQPIDRPWFTVQLRCSVQSPIALSGTPEGSVTIAVDPDPPGLLHLSGEGFDLKASITSIEPIRWTTWGPRTL